MSDINTLIKENLFSEGVGEHFKKHWKKYAVGAGIAGAAIGQDVIRYKLHQKEAQKASDKLNRFKKDAHQMGNSSAITLNAIKYVGDPYNSGFRSNKNKTEINQYKSAMKNDAKKSKSTFRSLKSEKHNAENKVKKGTITGRLFGKD